MILSRRGFLRGLGLVAPVAIVAPKYFFAPKGGWAGSGTTGLDVAAVTALELEKIREELSPIWEWAFVRRDGSRIRPAPFVITHVDRGSQTIYLNSPLPDGAKARDLFVSSPMFDRANRFLVGVGGNPSGRPVRGGNW